MELLTQAQISREFSVDKSLVSRDVKTGKLKPAGESPSGKPLFSRHDATTNYSNAYMNNRNINSVDIPPIKNKKIVVGKVDQRTVERKTLRENVDENLIVNKTGLDFDEWLIELFGDEFDDMTDQQKLARSRAVREARLAALEDLKVRKEQGLLIERAEVSLECREIGAEMTAILHNFPARLSPDLSVMTDQYEIKEYLINEINQLIDRMKAKLAEV